MSARIMRADASHLETLLPLFNGYREFYEQDRDENAARRYLEARVNNDQAVIFLAESPDAPGRGAGFVLLYPTFDSVALAAIWVLHDLFVDPACRGHGIGRLLMNAARKYCETTHCATTLCARIDLATSTDNHTAQTLYESLGYEHDREFYHYSLELPAHGD
jgi:GNAT superfamily N-acetyltransferase